MEEKIIKTRILEINEGSINEAAEIIRAGGVVAFPTETVYGLGVSAYMGEAVKQVFVVKNRPNDNPLIAHIAELCDVSLCTSSPSENALKLLKAYAPGPITVVVKKNGLISSEVTASLDTVGIRIPAHKLARMLIKAVGQPIAAPSANTSGRPSPTNAKDVFTDLNGKIPLILDGGACEVGIESTVVDCTKDVPIILRAGKITKEQIIAVCGACEVACTSSEIRSPGMKYRHYAPKIEVACYFNDDIGVRDFIMLNNSKKIVVIGDELKLNDTCFDSLDKQVLGVDVNDCMREYFAALRRVEDSFDLIICAFSFKPCDCEGLYNRVLKSCGKI